MFLTLWNVHRFHADYAALDGFDPDEEGGFVEVSERSPRSLWMPSRLHTVFQCLPRPIRCLGFPIKQVGIWNHSLLMTCPIGMCAEVGDDFWDEADSSDKRACQAHPPRGTSHSLPSDGTGGSIHAASDSPRPDWSIRTSC